MKQRKTEATIPPWVPGARFQWAWLCGSTVVVHSVSALCWLRETLEQGRTAESLLRSAQVECLPTCGASDWISPVLWLVVQIGNQCNHALLLAASVLRPALAASAGAVHVAIRIAETGFARVLFHFRRAGAAEAAGGFGFDCEGGCDQSSCCDQSDEESAHDALPGGLILQIPAIQVKKWQTML